MRQISKNSNVALSLPIVTDAERGEVVTNSSGGNLYIRQDNTVTVGGSDKIVEIYKGMYVFDVETLAERDQLAADSKIYTHQMCRFIDEKIQKRKTMIWMGPVAKWKVVEVEDMPPFIAYFTTSALTYVTFNYTGGATEFQWSDNNGTSWNTYSGTSPWEVPAAGSYIMYKTDGRVNVQFGNNDPLMADKFTGDIRIDANASTSCENMLKDCINVTSVSLQNYDPVWVKTTKNMFRGCTGLTTLDLSRFYARSLNDSSSMFEGCTGITSFDLMALEISEVTNASRMFAGCNSLPSVDLSSFITTNLVDSSEMFIGCTALTALDLSNFITPALTIIRGMFNGCSSLTTLIINTLMTGSVSDFSNIFNGCAGVDTLGVDTWDTGSATTMQNMFKGCTNLTTAYVGNFDTSGVTNMSSLFDGCADMTILDIDTWNTSSCTNMSRMFANCATAYKINPVGFDTIGVTTILEMFKGCSNIIDMDLQSFDTSGTTNTGSLFMDCVLLGCISNINTQASTNKANMFTNTPVLQQPDAAAIADIIDAGGANWTNVSICPTALTLEWDTMSAAVNVTVEGGDINYSNDGGVTWTALLPGVNLPLATGVGPYVLREIIPGTITRCAFEDNTTTMNLDGHMIASGGAGLTSTERMFDGAVNLLSIDVSRIISTGVTTMENMFLNNSSCLSINILGLDTPNLLNMADMFHGCTLIKFLNFSTFDMTSVTNNNETFRDCFRLECITNLDTVASTDKANLFTNCTTLLQPDGDNQMNLSDGNGAFWVNENVCDNYTPIIKTFDMQVRSLTEPGFTSNSPLQVDYLGDGTWNVWSEIPITTVKFNVNKTDVTEVWVKLAPDLNVGDEMFNGCTNLHTLTMDVVDTGLMTSHATMFQDCSSLVCLSQINTTASTDTTQMFDGCSSLERPTSPEIAAIKQAGGDDWVNDEICPKHLAFHWDTVTNDPTISIEGAVMEYTNDGGVNWIDKAIGVDVPLERGIGPYILREKVVGSVTRAAFDDNITGAYLNRNMRVIGGYGLTSTKKMFYNSANLRTVDVSQLITENVTDMESMFESCRGLSELDLLNFNTGNVTTMNKMFYGLTGLTYLDTSSFDMGNVIDTKWFVSESTHLICITNVDTRTSADKTDMFKNTPELVQPDGAAIVDITDASGANWVNANPCP